MSRAQEAKRREENEIEFSRIVAFSDGIIHHRFFGVLMFVDAERSGLTRTDPALAREGRRRALQIFVVPTAGRLVRARRT